MTNNNYILITSIRHLKSIISPNKLLMQQQQQSIIKLINIHKKDKITLTIMITILMITIIIIIKTKRTLIIIPTTRSSHKAKSISPKTYLVQL